MTIVRTKTMATGGITEEERIKLKEHADLWIKRIMRTDPIEPDKIIPAIEGLYEVSGLEKPKVVIVPSPLVMAIAGGIASIWWGNKLYKEKSTRSATLSATDSAIRSNTFSSTDSATLSVTDSITYSATLSATRSATNSSTYSSTLSVTDSVADSATRLATYSATRSVTNSVTLSATDSVTDSATLSTTNSATNLATRSATNLATRSATNLAIDVNTCSNAQSVTSSSAFNITESATDLAIYSATCSSTCSATYLNTYSLTGSVTRLATELVTDPVTYSIIDSVTNPNWIKNIAIYFNGEEKLEETLNEIKNWEYYYQGGNMWAQYDSYLTAMRDVIGLDLPEFKKYKYWEDCAIHGGFRYMHEKFCLVCDFPCKLRKNVQNQPHCEDGASHEWRDGWKLYHLFGMRFEEDEYWKVVKGEMSFKEIMQIKDVDKRTIAFRYCKPLELFEKTNSKLIKTQNEYELWKMPKGDVFDQDEYFLRYFCPSTKREYIKGVSPDDVKKLNYDPLDIAAHYHHFTAKQMLDKTFIST